jgi:hypothetical protein
MYECPKCGAAISSAKNGITIFGCGSSIRARADSFCVSSKCLLRAKDKRIAMLERALAKAVADVHFYSGQAGYGDVGDTRHVPYYKTKAQAKKELE